MRTKLSELRQNKNLTQEDIAEILGISRSTYAGYEQGVREMDYELLIKLADFYKVSLDYIFKRTSIPLLPDSYSDDEIEFMIRALELYKDMKHKFM